MAADAKLGPRAPPYQQMLRGRRGGGCRRWRRKRTGDEEEESRGVAAARARSTRRAGIVHSVAWEALHVPNALYAARNAVQFAIPLLWDQPRRAPQSGGAAATAENDGENVAGGDAEARRTCVRNQRPPVLPPAVVPAHLPSLCARPAAPCSPRLFPACCRRGRFSQSCQRGETQ